MDSFLYGSTMLRTTGKALVVLPPSQEWQPMIGKGRGQVLVQGRGQEAEREVQKSVCDSYYNPRMRSVIHAKKVKTKMWDSIPDDNIDRDWDSSKDTSTFDKGCNLNRDVDNSMKFVDKRKEKRLNVQDDCTSKDKEPLKGSDEDDLRKILSALRQRLEPTKDSKTDTNQKTSQYQLEGPDCDPRGLLDKTALICAGVRGHLAQGPLVRPSLFPRVPPYLHFPAVKGGRPRDQQKLDIPTHSPCLDIRWQVCRGEIIVFQLFIFHHFTKDCLLKGLFGLPNSLNQVKEGNETWQAITDTIHHAGFTVTEVTK